ncbi:MAG: lysylphosphatidylglycerol synthase domain-containing protein [Magnetovibrionaceae bacterium]
MKHVKRVAIILFLVGLAGAIALILWQGAEAVFASLAAGGLGLFGMIPLFVPPLLAAVLGWWLLFPVDCRPGFGTAFYAGWLGQAMNSLLPVAQVGGEIVKARIVAGKGLPGAIAGAASVVDKTAQAIAQMLSALIGMALLSVIAKAQGQMLLAMAAATVIICALIYGFYRVQKAGLFPLLARIIKKLADLAAKGKTSNRLESLTGGAQAMETAIQEIYGRRLAFLLACLLRLANRLLMAAEIWLALWLIGYPVTLAEALLLDSLNQTARSAAFFVPGGLGVQEGSFVLIGLLIGLPPSAALAASLARRGREIITGVPVLLAWNWAELKTLLASR